MGVLEDVNNTGVVLEVLFGTGAVLEVLFGAGVELGVLVEGSGVDVVFWEVTVIGAGELGTAALLTELQ